MRRSTEISLLDIKKQKPSHGNGSMSYPGEGFSIQLKGWKLPVVAIATAAATAATTGASATGPIAAWSTTAITTTTAVTTTIAAATTVAAPITTAATIATATTAIAIRAALAFFTWAGRIDHHITTIEIRPVQRLNGRLGFSVFGHLNEAKATRFAGQLIFDQRDGFDLPIRSENLPNIVLCCSEWQVAYVNIHSSLSLNSLDNLKNGGPHF